MSHGVSTTIRLAAVIPLAALLLTACGGSGGSSTGDLSPVESTPQNAVTTPDSPATSAPAKRYEVSAVTTCDAAEPVLAAAEATPTPTETDPVKRQKSLEKQELALQNALRSALQDVVDASTTPKASFAKVKVDKLMRYGCPDVHAKALNGTGLSYLADLQVK